MPTKKQDAIQLPDAKVLRDNGLRWAWIQFQIKSRGGTFAALAEKHGLERHTLLKAKAIHYPRMERIIAEALGFTAAQLFPTRYNKYGVPSERYRGRNHNPTKRQQGSESGALVGVAGAQ